MSGAPDLLAGALLALVFCLLVAAAVVADRAAREHVREALYWRTRWLIEALARANGREPWRVCQGLMVGVGAANPLLVRLLDDLAREFIARRTAEMKEAVRLQATAVGSELRPAVASIIQGWNGPDFRLPKE